MSKVIQFPNQNNDELSIYEKKINDALSNVIPEVRSKITSEVIDVLNRHNSFSKGFSLSFPSNITEEQVEAVKNAFEGRNLAIQKLIGELIQSKVQLLIEQYKNS